MNILSITLAGVCASFLALSVKNTKSNMGQMVTLASAVCLMLATAPYIIRIVASLKELSGYSVAGEKYLEPIIKITGVAYISRIGAQLCSDCGENTLAERVESAGKIAIGVITIPIAREAFAKIMGILS